MNTDRRDVHLSHLRSSALFPKENVLQPAQVQPPVYDRDLETGWRQRRADVSGHVVRTFAGQKIGITFWHQVSEKSFDVGDGVGLLNQQGGRGVPDEDRAHAVRNARCADHGLNVLRDWVKSFAACGREPQRLLMDFHSLTLRVVARSGKYMTLSSRRSEIQSSVEVPAVGRMTVNAST